VYRGLQPAEIKVRRVRRDRVVRGGTLHAALTTDHAVDAAKKERPDGTLLEISAVLTRTRGVARGERAQGR